jgi:hypothetical protein
MINYSTVNNSIRTRRRNNFIETSNGYEERLDRYSSVIICISFFFASIGKANFYSIFYSLLGTIFVIKLLFMKRRTKAAMTHNHDREDMSNEIINYQETRMLAKREKKKNNFESKRRGQIIFLRIFAILVWICISIQLVLRLWTPPSSHKYSERIDLSPLCDGETKDGNENSSREEKIACIDNWQRWLNIPSTKLGGTELIENQSVSNSISESLGLSSSKEKIFSPPVIKEYFILYDFLILWLVCICLQNKGKKFQSL